MTAVCVFCSASDCVDEIYFNDAYETGKLIAKEKMDFVYGGSELGLMGKSSLGAYKNGAKTIGVMPEKLYNMGVGKGNCTEFVLVEGMRERKAKMDELSNAIIALAGGFGTLEELAEIIVQKKLGYNDKAIVILNTNGFYDTLIKFFNELIDKNFANKSFNEAYFVAKTPREAIEYIKNYKPSNKIVTKEDIYVKA